MDLNSLVPIHTSGILMLALCLSIGALAGLYIYEYVEKNKEKN